MQKENFGVFFCPTIRATEEIAARLAQLLFVQDVILLQGDLGVGKTTFAQALIRTCAVSSCMPKSPTFPCTLEYKVAQGRLLHCDFYRLRQADEVFAFNLEEVLDHDILLVEWAERVPPDLFPQDHLVIQFSMQPAGRFLHVSGSPAWKARIESLALPES
ncbi:MAG: tRNA (adenosine(37)-N6)-threonylcarbamoyltransferase complex ATPase subunit type 1 TsaE [Holosporales bacterium]|jgi:tRNA threonylcarbamoyl adenosine modification protein YjeE|nr:tRNA (adenosine(37)-N6)-threonylcarbamoyltransferase complex ATPase subunit type 1 TsaE [Holosporales bacterium]